jgi:hypothetical protein
MGQFLPDRLFWAREEPGAPAEELGPARISDAQHRH